MEPICCLVSDKWLLASAEDSATRILSSAQADGAATFFELSSLALSHGEGFVRYTGSWTGEERDAFLRLADLAKRTIQDPDSCSLSCHRVQPRPCPARRPRATTPSLYLTTPLFLSMLTAADGGPTYFAKHVDTQTYNNTHMRYSATLYLRDHGLDFEGGRLVFDSPTRTRHTSVRPQKGLAVMFSSGDENPHHVERVTSGIRIALTMFFTDDVKYKYKDTFSMHPYTE